MAASRVKAPKVPAKWIRNEADREAIRQGYYFDQAEADFVCGLFEGVLKLTLARWAGEPFILEPWQRDYLSRLYGWMRDDGTRRFRETYLEIPKKNGKSTLFSGLAIVSLLEERGAEVYIGAVNSQQSAIIYREVCRMIAASPDLAALMKPANKRFVAFPENDAFLEALTAEIEAKDGANASATFLDEVHRYPKRRIYDLFKFAGAARDQPLLASLTTAGTDFNSLAGELHNEARRIERGATDNLEFLGVVYSAMKPDGSMPSDEELDDPATWRRANPSMGSIIKERDFAREWAEAKRIPGRLHQFKRLRLGLWLPDATEWLPMDLWDQARNPAGLYRSGDRVAFNPEWWRGRKCNLGVDLSSVADLTALTLTTMDDDVLQWHSVYFVPSRTKSLRSARDGVPYDEWVRAGWIIETDGDAADYGAIRKWINDLRDHGVTLGTIGFDPWNAYQLMMELQDEDGFNVREIRQIMTNLTAPSKELERRLLNGTLAHDGNPATRWCASNVVVVTDPQGNIMPSKKASARGRIDGIASGIMSLGLTTGRQEPEAGAAAV